MMKTQAQSTKDAALLSAASQLQKCFEEHAQATDRCSELGREINGAVFAIERAEDPKKMKTAARQLQGAMHRTLDAIKNAGGKSRKMADALAQFRECLTQEVI